MGQRITGLHYRPGIITIIDILIELYGIAVRNNHSTVHGCRRVELIHTAVQSVCTACGTARVGTRSIEFIELTTIDGYCTRCTVLLVVLDVLVGSAADDISVTIGEHIAGSDVLQNDGTVKPIVPSAGTVDIKERSVADSHRLPGNIILHTVPTAIGISVHVNLTFRTGEGQVGIEIFCNHNLRIRRTVETVLRRGGIGSSQIDCARVFSARNGTFYNSATDVVDRYSIPFRCSCRVNRPSGTIYRTGSHFHRMVPLGIEGCVLGQRNSCCNRDCQRLVQKPALEYCIRIGMRRCRQRSRNSGFKRANDRITAIRLIRQQVVIIGSVIIRHQRTFRRLESTNLAKEEAIGTICHLYYLKNRGADITVLILGEVV